MSQIVALLRLLNQLSLIGRESVSLLRPTMQCLKKESNSVCFIQIFNHKFVINDRKQKEAELDEAVRRQEQTKATREKVRRADEFRQFQLLARCAWSPWVRLLEERRFSHFNLILYHTFSVYIFENSLNEQKAANFARDALLQRAWDNFLGYYQAKKLEQYRALAKKQTLATAHYRFRATILLVPIVYY